MDIISLVMLILGLIGIVFGFLYGKRRGLCKATIRIVLIALSALIAFFLRESITETVLNLEIDGDSIIGLITEGMASGEDADKMKGLMNIIVNILTMVLQIFVFIITFISLRIVTLILFWIIAPIVTAIKKSKLRKEVEADIDAFAEGRKLSRKQRKLVEAVRADKETLAVEEDDNRSARKTRKHLAKVEKKLVKKTAKRERKKWWGSLVGLAQGALVATFVVAPISCLVGNLSALVTSLTLLEMDGEALLDKDTAETLEEIGVIGYSESSVYKVYDMAGGWLYRSISTIKNEDGTTTNIESQIEAVDGGVQMVDAVSKLAEINFDDGFTEDSKDELVDIFNELDRIKNDMSEDSVEELDKLVKEALTPMLEDVSEELPIDLDEISFANVDFAKEGEVIDSFYDLYEKAENGEDMSEEEMMEEVITTLSESTLILPVLSQAMENLPEDEKPNFSEEEKEQIEDIIDGLKNKENEDALKALFGIK